MIRRRFLCFFLLFAVPLSVCGSSACAEDIPGHVLRNLGNVAGFHESSGRDLSSDMTGAAPPVGNVLEGGNPLHVNGRQKDVPNRFQSDSIRVIGRVEDRGALRRADNDGND